MDDLNNCLDLLKSQYPPPLPPTRKIELIRTDVNTAGPCCSCRKSTGKLTCGRCKAIKYCGQQCQKMMEGMSEGKEGSMKEGKNGWKDHKNICNEIKKRTEETKAAIEKLEEEFRGTDTLLQSPLVKKGLFKLMGRFMRARNAKEEYILARLKLTDAYVLCGKEALSCTAFRLAAENMLDVLCLTYSQSEEQNPYMRYYYCGCMVAAGMDQKALNFICYFRHRIMSPHSLPYLDMSRDEDIEGVSYLKLFKEKDYLDMWLHDYMLIALIKYKRLQLLNVQRNEKPLMELLLTMQLLESQIKRILSKVHACDPLIIPSLIDRNSLPAKTLLKDKDMAAKSDDEADLKVLEAYDFAWFMSPAYIKVLKYFLQTGRIEEQELTTISEVAEEDGGKITAPDKGDGPEKVSTKVDRQENNNQTNDATTFPNEDYPDVKQSKKNVDGWPPGAGLLQAAVDTDLTRSCSRADVLNVEGHVPLNLEFVKENIGKETEKEKVPEISKKPIKEVSALKMYCNICWFCSKEGVKLYKCGCRKARYCTKECQEDDWEEHGGYCIKKQERRKAKEREGGVV